jgi:aspartate/methionine/tyrosine aminotransferase
MVRFSQRVPSDLRPNRLAQARARLGESGFDLTESNPTRCDLPYPDDLLQTLTDPSGLRYEPDPRGMATARQAIADWYRRAGIEVVPERIVLTASTSEAYSFLFRMLADPGDSILVPSPSYPLFDQLAGLDGVRPMHYALDPGDRWRIDPASVGAIRDHCRVIVAVHPNNPTGSYVHPEDAGRLTGLCIDHELALIVDEVFLPYPLHGAGRGGRSFADTTACLTFTLSGLSKSIGLPQIKLAWIVTSGPQDEVEEALERLEYVADAYLSVNTPIAVALPELLRRCEPVRDAISTRCRENLARLHRLAAALPHVTVPPADGGWSAVLRIPNVVDEEDLVLELLEQHDVAVHPGFFFDFPADGFLVVSLLPPEPIFAEGVRRMFGCLEQLAK